MDVLEDSFTVSVIPETLKRTTLGLRKIGDRVNVEVDMLMKGIRGQGTVDRGQVSEDMLKKAGFIR